MVRFLRWFRSQDTGVKAALITLTGTLTAALITATVTLFVALNRPPTASGTPSPPTPPLTTPASDTPAPGPPSSPSRPDPPEPTTAPPSTPRDTPTTASTPAPAPTAESRVRWQGSLRLDGTAGVRGWFLDDAPPGRAPVGDLAVQGAAQLYGAYALARWTDSRPPTRAQCATLLNTRLGQQSLDVQKGDRACVGTENLRVAAVEVTDIPDADHIDLAVTVWQRA
ncbi:MULTISPECIES: hypothetical protein [unclassified Streptomyces]|uniref:hypothetical protein n=1 Tax=unclassified Streptomyces TaxID=2593676 RepID=UPI002257F0B8|nr:MULTISPECIES: hypothetical protein [unclassified Streptomyces]MCX5060584.1 hypothetical protein [Streptomyces sp. NBC_00452]MCX5293826.1 hypothetical protein [Streptomyces sp. NBC_00183]